MNPAHIAKQNFGSRFIPLFSPCARLARQQTLFVHWIRWRDPAVRLFGHSPGRSAGYSYGAEGQFTKHTWTWTLCFCGSAFAMWLRRDAGSKKHQRVSCQQTRVVTCMMAK